MFADATAGFIMLNQEANVKMYTKLLNLLCEATILPVDL